MAVLLHAIQVQCQDSECCVIGIGETIYDRMQAVTTDDVIVNTCCVDELAVVCAGQQRIW